LTICNKLFTAVAHNFLYQQTAVVQILLVLYSMIGGAAVAQCCDTNRKVAGSIPAGVIGNFSLAKYLSDRTMALGSTQPLTEMSTRNISWGGGIKAAGA